MENLIWLWSFCAVFVQRRSLFFLHIPSLDTTCFGLTGQLQVYRLLWLRILLLTEMRFSFLVLLLPLVILVMWVTINFICPFVARDCFAIMWNALCWSLLRYICIFNYCIYDITYCFVWFCWLLLPRMFLLGREFCFVLVGHYNRSLWAFSWRRLCCYLWCGVWGSVVCCYLVFVSCFIFLHTLCC
jgi:hypothetical protein